MPYKTKASPGEKVMLIEKYLAGVISVVKACEITRVEQSSFKEWIRIYRHEGTLGLVCVGRKRTYDPELKRNAVKAYLSGEGILWDVSARFKLRSWSTITTS